MYRLTINRSVNAEVRPFATRLLLGLLSATRVETRSLEPPAFFKEADLLSEAIARLRVELSNGRSDQESKLLQTRLAALTDRYWAIERMPTWPVGNVVRQRLAINNLTLLTPFILKALAVC